MGYKFNTKQANYCSSRKKKYSFGDGYSQNPAKISQIKQLILLMTYTTENSILW